MIIPVDIATREKKVGQSAHQGVPLFYAFYDCFSVGTSFISGMLVYSHGSRSSMGVLCKPPAAAHTARAPRPYFNRNLGNGTL